MKTLHITIMLIMLLFFSIFQVPVFAQQDQQNSTALSYQECQNRIGNEMQKTVDSINKTKVVLLAIHSNEFQSKTNGYRYVYSDIFTNMTEDQNVCGDVKLTGIVVEFSILNGSSNFVKFIQVGEDPQISHVTLVEDAFVSNCDNSCPPPSPPAGNVQKPLTSPLRQIASGVSPKDVKCRQDLTLIFRAADNFPACVKQDDIDKLVHRGWAQPGLIPSIKTPHVVPHLLNPVDLSQPCEIPYPQPNNGIAVLYMPANSTGKICVQYTNSNPPQPAGLRIFEAHHIDQDTQDITSYATPATIKTGNSTIVYTVTTGNHVGFYGLTIFCVGKPFAVGYDSNSTFVEGDFPWFGGTYYCPAQFYNYHIVGLSGIGVKYIPYH